MPRTACKRNIWLLRLLILIGLFLALAPGVLAHDGAGDSCDVCAAIRQEAGPVRLLAAGTPPSDFASTYDPARSQGQQNIVKRARQFLEIEWTPLQDVYQWGYAGVFRAGTTYSGVPYGQPVDTGYVGYQVTLTAFLEAVNDNGSVFYAGYSNFNKIAPYYSSDCSGFVSYAWGLSARRTTRTIPEIAERLANQGMGALEVGDCLNKSGSHVVLVTQVCRNTAGTVTSVDIMEQTPVIVRHTRYGEGGTKTLGQLESDYLKSGYAIYRYPGRDNVTYKHDCAVPIDGDYCASCRAAAPYAAASPHAEGLTVTLRHGKPDAVIYYTLDGADPMQSGSLYTGPLTICETAQLRAVGRIEGLPNAAELKYTVTVPQVAAPVITVTEGVADGGRISQNAKIKLSTATAGAVIYYTTDGSEPTRQSAQYAQELAVTDTMELRCMAAMPGMQQSETVAASYELAKAYTVTVMTGPGGMVSHAGTTLVLEANDLTLTFSPQSGYAVADVRINGTSLGAVRSHTLRNMQFNVTVEVSFGPAIGVLPFSDVSGTAWYYAAVAEAYASGLFHGTSDTSFSPNGTMTRAMFVTVLGRVADVPADGKLAVVTGVDANVREAAGMDAAVLATAGTGDLVQLLEKEGNWYKLRWKDLTGYVHGDHIRTYDGGLSDLEADRYYTAYAEWAYLTGILSARSFDAATDIRREDMCVLLYNYAAAAGFTLPTPVPALHFTDADAISPYAAAAVEALQRAGVVSGMGDGSFAPQATATRAQVAQIYMKFLEAVA